MSLRALQKHLASHQQQLSLFALPPNLDETEDDEDEEDRRSQGMQESDDDNISDVSDTRNADESSTLKIPWRLCTREYHWSFLDDKVESSNTDQLPLIVLQDQHSWTEILASWVLREVIEEAGYPFRQVQKDDLAGDGRQTCYLIEQALQYPQVRQLVERTAEFDLRKEATTRPVGVKDKRMDDAAEEYIMPTRDTSDSYVDQNPTSKTVPDYINRVQVRFPAYDDFAWANIERYLRQKWPSWNDFKPCRLGHDWSFQVPEQLTEVHNISHSAIKTDTQKADYMELRRRRDGLGRRRRPSVQSEAGLDEHRSQQTSETDLDNRSAYNEIDLDEYGDPLTDTADMYNATETIITDRESARELGPPPSTRGFDRLNYSGPQPRDNLAYDSLPDAAPYQSSRSSHRYLEWPDQSVAVEDDTNRGRGETLSAEERGRSMHRGGGLAAERASNRPFVETRDDQGESEQNEDEEMEAVIQHVAAPGYYIASDGRQYLLSQMPSPPTVAAPGYYIASDGRQYPLPQMPQKSEDIRRAVNPDSEATGSRIWPVMHQQSAVAKVQSQTEEAIDLNGPAKQTRPFSANQWFVPGDGIAREVITHDITRYLGPDALVRPGVGIREYEGQGGYWITAYGTPTAQMIQDMKMDTQRWIQERARDRGVAYHNSKTHAARQHWGPSKPFDHPT
jgi:hypothetical protein